MTEIIQADIFFFTATVGLALLAVLGVIALIYIINILARVRRLTKKAEMEGEFFIDELRRMRHKIEIERFGISGALAMVRRIYSRYF